MKKLRITCVLLIFLLLVQMCAFAAPRIPVYKVGGVLFFLDKSSGTITGFAGDPRDLTIPTELGGYKVVAIGPNAFWGSETLSTLSVPEGISVISSNAFASCPNLTSVEIASSVSYIGNGAFRDCPNLTNVTFSGTVRNIETDAFSNTLWISSNPAEFAILDSTLLKYNGSSEDVIVPDGIKHIAANAFAYNTTVKRISLPDGLETIGDNAFVHCYNLINVDIPSTVSQIGIGAFDDTIWMRNQQSEFVVVNGILVSYNGSDKHIEIPGDITAIGAGAFMGNTNLTSVHLQKSIIYIDSMAFSACPLLIQINIPSSVEWIDEHAFSNCPRVTLYGSFSSYAESYAKYMDIPFSTEVYVSYNGKKMHFDNAAPIIYYERTFLPLRALMEMMGFTVTWESSTGIVTCVKGNKVVTVSPAGEIVVDGEVSPTVAPPINVNGSNLVSARVISEAVNADVEWDNSTRTVKITY